MDAGRTGTSTDVLHGWRLGAVRFLWAVLALSAVGMLALGLGIFWTEAQKVCLKSVKVCSNENLLTPQNVRELRGMGVSGTFYAAYTVGVNAATAAVWCGVGAVIFLRRSADRMALLTSLFLVIFGTLTFNLIGFQSLLTDGYPVLWLPLHGLQFLGEVLIATFFCTFPDGRFVPRWSLILAACYVVTRLPVYFFPNSFVNPENLPEPFSTLLFFGMILGFVIVQLYRYRRVSGPEQRRQTRWVVFGATAGVLGFAATIFSFAFTQPDGYIHISYVGLLQLTLLGASLALIPSSIGVAVLRSNLFDVDVVINRALVYGSLTATLAAVYVGGVLLLQTILRYLTGESSQFAVVASTLAIAALFNPFRKRIQSFIDRMFYRGKYDAQKTLETFSAHLRKEVELDALGDDLVSVVRETVQPAGVSLWLLEPERRAGRPGVWP